MRKSSAASPHVTRKPLPSTLDRCLGCCAVGAKLPRPVPGPTQCGASIPPNTRMPPQAATSLSLKLQLSPLPGATIWFTSKSYQTPPLRHRHDDPSLALPVNAISGFRKLPQGTRPGGRGGRRGRRCPGAKSECKRGCDLWDFGAVLAQGAAGVGTGKSGKLSKSEYS